MKIAVLGGGNMGYTYAKAFVRSNIVEKENLLIIERFSERRAELEKDGLATITDKIEPGLGDYNILILATKPQDFKKVAEELKPILKKEQLVISVMAGVTIATMSKHLGHDKIARAMPNTPAQLGFGITAFAINKDSSYENISEVDTLLETTGKSIFMKDEAMLDAVTGISGSGPAYFFYIAKHMIEAGKEMGLDPAIAAMLVKQTMLGSFQILNNNKSSIDDLIASVASRGGTTQAALDKLIERKVGEGINEAVKAAEKRAKELSAE
ncbi:pyrroline-5-carboxylate reductase [Cytophagaceae bacterium ABcell3]|nr:pyrroline-5-carboxylate reductase [Cytophagaceae bacterium ABcell3]